MQLEGFTNYTRLMTYFSLKEEELSPQGRKSLTKVQVFPTRQTHKRYRSVILLKIHRLKNLKWIQLLHLSLLI